MGSSEIAVNKTKELPDSSQSPDSDSWFTRTTWRSNNMITLPFFRRVISQGFLVHNRIYFMMLLTFFFYFYCNKDYWKLRSHYTDFSSEFWCGIFPVKDKFNDRCYQVASWDMWDPEFLEVYWYGWQRLTISQPCSIEHRAVWSDPVQYALDLPGKQSISSVDLMQHSV